MSEKKPITDERARQFYVHATAWDMEEVPKSSGSANARAVLAREWDAWLAAHDTRVRREAKAEAWQEGVNFALPGKETYWISKHNPHRATETGDQR